MLRKFLLATVAVLGVTLLGTDAADAGWRRAYRHGYYAPYYGGYSYRVPRRSYYGRRYAAPPAVYAYPGYAYPGYAYPGYSYGPTYYYGPGYGAYYGPGFGVTTRNWGFYIR